MEAGLNISNLNSTVVTSIISTTNGTLARREVIMDTISQLSGILSLSVWLFAQLPQVIENYMNRSVSGISLAFLSCWIAGDVTNLIGCILTKALPFQTCLAGYYCFVDLILSTQYWYYTKIYPKQKVHHNMLQSPNMMTPVTSKNIKVNSGSRRNRFEQDITRSPIDITNSHYNIQQNRGSFIRRILASSVLGGSLTKKASAYPINMEPQDNEHGENLLVLLKRNFIVLCAFIARALSGFQIKISSNKIGIVSAWMCSILYLTSRSPQIYKNYNSKSTKGISVYLFLFAMLGNTFYTISVISNLYLLKFDDRDIEDLELHKILMSQLPFIVGSCGTVVFDLIILFQCWYFGNSPNSRHSSHSSHSHHETNPELNRFNEANSNDSPLYFQKPDWYTNNHRYELNPESFENEIPTNDRKFSYRRNSRIDDYNNRSPLKGKNHTSYDSVETNYAPSHYISASFSHSNSQANTKSSGMFTNTLNVIANSFSRNNSRKNSIAHTRAPSSSASFLSSSFNNSNSNQVAFSPLTTSLLPSIIGNYSSVSKKMTNDSKIPFSPIDFLSDEFHQPVSGASFSSRSPT